MIIKKCFNDKLGPRSGRKALRPYTEIHSKPIRNYQLSTFRTFYFQYCVTDSSKTENSSVLTLTEKSRNRAAI